MRDGLLARGITLKRYSPGEQRMVCPKCGGGSSAEHCFSITIDPDGQTAKWKCFRATCGFQGGYTVGSPYRPATSREFSLCIVGRAAAGLGGGGGVGRVRVPGKRTQLFFTSSLAFPLPSFPLLSLFLSQKRPSSRPARKTRLRW